MIIFVVTISSLLLMFQNPIRDLVFKPTVVAKIVGTALETGGTESGAIRKIVWKGAVNIWLGNVKNFMIGAGPETFAQAYYQYRPAEHNNTSEWELLYNKAHNEFLNQLATTGILGFVAYILLLMIMLKTFGLKNIALLAGWITISITNFWGFSVVVTQLLLFLLPAMSASLEQESVRAGEYKWDNLSILGIIISCSSTLLLFYFVCKYWLADVKYASGGGAHKAFQASNDPQYLLSEYQYYLEAYQKNPSEPAIASDFGLSAAYLATAMRAQSTASAQLASQSLSLSQIAINASPKHPNYYKNLTRGLILMSEMDSSYLDAAKQAMQAAALISPTDPRIPYYLGVITSAQGATSEAKLYFQKSLDLKPDFADAQRQLKN